MVEGVELGVLVSWLWERGGGGCLFLRLSWGVGGMRW